MAKSSLTQKYELIVIVDGKLTNDAKEVIKKEVTDAIIKHDGKVINSQVWLEKQKFTFLIKKCDEGTYYIINFEGENEIVKKLQPILKLNEKILRFAFIKADAKATAEAAPATA